jgi:uncharacterized coiled-coil DUF342 family protein
MFVLKSTYALLKEKYDTLNMSYKLYVKKCKSLSAECDELLSENIKQKSEINMLNSYIRELQKGNPSLTYMDFKNPKVPVVTESPIGKFERLNQHLNEVAEEIRQKSRETPPPQSTSHFYMTQDTSSSWDYSSDSSTCSSSSSSSSSSSDSSSCSSSD